MSKVEFPARTAKRRARFFLTLAAGIEEASGNLPKLLGFSRDAAEAAAKAYLLFHEMSRAGPAVGFTETGRAARALDTALSAAWRSRRGLTEGELAKVRKGLAHVRAAMHTEMGGSAKDLAS
jgi:hypothetical protein